ncbi:MAG: LytTR family DNA-binding domain-containing protein [Ferruginibacter sp.]
MIRCIIVDDEQHAIDLLSNHISKIPLLDLRFATTDSLKAFQYINQQKANLIFLDIQMPELDGIQFLKLLKGKSKVILTTAYSEYALEGYEHDIVDYLLKPIVFERFLKAAQKAIDLLTKDQIASTHDSNEVSNENDFIFIKTEGRSKITRVLLKDIEYIEALGNYLSIHTSSGKLITLLTIKEMEKKLPAKFIRIHHSYIVPVNKIAGLEGNQVHIDKHKLPIGDVYKKSFMNRIEKHIMRNKK